MRKWLILCALILAPTFVFAQISSDDIGLTETAQEAGFDTGSETEIGTYVGQRIITPLFSILGIVFLILIIYGGIIWMTGGGNTELIKKARGIILNSIIGLFIIILAYGFTIFVFQTLLPTGS